MSMYINRTGVIRDKACIKYGKSFTIIDYKHKGREYIVKFDSVVDGVRNYKMYQLRLDK